MKRRRRSTPNWSALCLLLIVSSILMAPLLTPGAALAAGPGDTWTWGRNQYGQIGDGTQTQRHTRVQVLTGVAALAGGDAHSLALKSDGTVWGWGYNASGQVGDGTGGYYPAMQKNPVQVSGSLRATAVAASGSHSLALKYEGTVWGWGSNGTGQIGDGSSTNRLTPVQTLGINGVTAVAAAAQHSLALKSDGTVRAWGYNMNGELGDGTQTGRTTPVQVSGLTGVRAIGGGGFHSLAAKSDGTAWAWGRNTYGELGDGSTTRRLLPVPVSGITGVIAVAGGYDHSLALKSDGTVWAWGYNFYGQLGDGSTTTRLTPVQVEGLTGVTAIAAGRNHNLALKSDGTVWAWGSSSNGQVGDGYTVNRHRPVQVSGITSIAAIAGGGFHSMARAFASPPPGTTLTHESTTPDGIPVVNGGTDATLTTQGCAGGTANYLIVRGSTTVSSGGMTEGPAGAYSATVPALAVSGLAQVTIALQCPSPQVMVFDVIYLEPNGAVRTTTGIPIPGATVTLYTSDDPAGPFVQVPDGSTIMSMANRHNPDLTDALGRFGWDVTAGFYKVRAEMAGCVSPTAPGQTYVETDVLTIPPPVTSLDLRLSCPQSPPTAVTLASFSVGSDVNGWLFEAGLVGLTAAAAGIVFWRRKKDK